MNIIEELFYGNISAADMRKSKKYKQACEKELEVYHKLKATLNKEQDNLLEELLEANSNSAEICEKNFFTYGFKIGLHIGIESNKLNN